MKRGILISLGVLLLSSVLVLREWLIKKEVESLQSELISSLTQSLASAQSFDRIDQMSKSFSVYDRYLEPVVHSGQRMIWPPLRQDILKRWENRVHRTLEDKSYLRLVELRSEIQKKLEEVRSGQAPSNERLQEVVKLTAELDSETERLEHFRAEMAAIDQNLKELDEKLFAGVKEAGISKLKALRNAINKMNDTQFRRYISSQAFIDEYQKPVVHQIMDVNSVQLRKNMWDEYSKALSRVLSQKARLLARVEKLRAQEEEDLQAKLEEEIAAPIQSMAELFREEKDLNFTPIPFNPSSAH